MAETAIQFLERWRQARVYAELRAAADPSGGRKRIDAAGWHWLTCHTDNRLSVHCEALPESISEKPTIASDCRDGGPTRHIRLSSTCARVFVPHRVHDDRTRSL
jgi:hypothetical protein